MTKCIKKCYLDSNFLIYLKNEDSPFNSQASNLIKKILKTNLRPIISPLVLDEFIHQFRLLSINQKIKPSTIFTNTTEALKQIFNLPNLTIVNPPNSKKSQLKIVKLMEKFSLRPRDAYHLLIMQHHNIKYFTTFDNDFKKVFSSKIVTKI